MSMEPIERSEVRERLSSEARVGVDVGKPGKMTVGSVGDDRVENKWVHRHPTEERRRVGDEDGQKDDEDGGPMR